MSEGVLINAETSYLEAWEITVLIVCNPGHLRKVYKLQSHLRIVQVGTISTIQRSTATVSSHACDTHIRILVSTIARMARSCTCILTSTNWLYTAARNTAAPPFYRARSSTLKNLQYDMHDTDKDI